MRFPRVQLSPRAQRRVRKIRDNVGWYAGYPVFVIGTASRAIGSFFAEWWRHRNLLYLLQGLPALIVGIALITFGANVYFQDRDYLATEYRREAEQNLFKANTLKREKKDATAQLALAETYFQRLITLQDNHENRFRIAMASNLKEQIGQMVAMLQSIAPSD